MTQQVDAFIVDPELDTRNRLKQAMSLVTQFRRSIPFQSTESVLAKLRDEPPPDIVFLSEAIGIERIATFIQTMKRTVTDRSVAYVLVLSAESQDAGTMALSVLAGADTFLLEPYSVTSLLDIAAVAGKLRDDFARQAEEQAVRVILTDIRTRLAYISTLRALGYDIMNHVRRLKAKCALLQSLSSDSMDLYTRVLNEVFEQATPPYRHEYMRALSGPSKRVKKRTLDRLVERINDDLKTGS